PDELLGAHRVNDVLERIGFMHLVRRKMAEYHRGRQLPAHPSSEPPALSDFTLPAAHKVRSLSYSPHWRPAHDGQLLRGLLLYGYGQWQRIIKDPALGLKAALRQELGIPVEYDSSIVPSGGVAATAAAVTEADGAAAAVVKKEEGVKQEEQEEGKSQVTDAAAAASPKANAASAATAGGGVTREKARSYASTETRWLTRRLSYISEALNWEYLSNPGNPHTAVAALKIAPRVANKSAGADGGATAASGLQRAAAAAAASGRPATSPDAFLTNLIPARDFPSAPAPERALKRQLIEQYNTL
ncbi:hypothetical protein Agub_g14074, partial [Astrephomene gubernaculifera]